MKLSIGRLAPGFTDKSRRLIRLGLALSCLIVLLSDGTEVFAAPASPGAARPAPAAASSDWPSYLHDPARTAANPGETPVSNTNACNLTLAWSSHTGQHI